MVLYQHFDTHVHICKSTRGKGLNLSTLQSRQKARFQFSISSFQSLLFRRALRSHFGCFFAPGQTKQGKIKNSICGSRINRRRFALDRCSLLSLIIRVSRGIRGATYGAHPNAERAETGKTCAYASLDGWRTNEKEKASEQKRKFMHWRPFMRLDGSCFP